MTPEPGRTTTENVEIREEEPAVEGTMSPEALAAVRELALRAYPETVPELVGGQSVEEVVQSVEAASAAYRRIAEGIGARPPVVPAVPAVPAGSAPPVTVDPERLPAVEKIRRGLAARR